jgi:hypothetical protein
LRFLKKNGFKNLKGCDLSEEQVELAKKDGFQVVLQDAQSFVESTENWDALVAIDVLEHLTKDEAVALLKQIRSRINTSGKQPQALGDSLVRQQEFLRGFTGMSTIYLRSRLTPPAKLRLRQIFPLVAHMFGPTT